MNDITLFAKAFVLPTRIRIIALLRQAELCVCEISDAMEMHQSTLSTHLQVIRLAGLVTTAQDGKWIYYGIEPSHADLVDAVFAHYRDTLNMDRRLTRDADRLTQRLKLRKRGRCVLGFDQLDKS